MKNIGFQTDIGRFAASSRPVGAFKSLALGAALALAVLAGPTAFAADDIVVTGSARTDGLLSSLSLSFPSSDSPTRLFLAWGAEDRGASLGNWDVIDWLADVPAGATSCDAPVATLRSGLPFVRVFRIAPDDSVIELEGATADGRRASRRPRRRPSAATSRSMRSPTRRSSASDRPRGRTPSAFSPSFPPAARATAGASTTARRSRTAPSIPWPGGAISPRPTTVG